MQDKKLIVVAGPTAVGKTAVAVKLALHYQTEILSADARQVYKELEKGTAKPNRQELAAVKHHFVDSVSIHEPFNAGMYGEQARHVLERLFENHRHVVISGGSGLYIRAALEGFDSIPEVPAEVRASVTSEFQEKGLAWLQESVATGDPMYFESVDRQNPQRLMRALEVIRHTGVPFSDFHGRNKIILPYTVVKVALKMDRDMLYQRIDDRMEAMISDGLFEEAAGLFPLRHLPALQTVGYQEIFGWLEGLYDRDEAIRLLKRNSRRYAKRQLTWFGSEADYTWFAPEDIDQMIQHIDACTS